MNRKIMIAAMFAFAASAQRHEIGFTLGTVLPAERSATPSRLELGTGRALQANYGYRLAGDRKWAALGEVHLLAAPLREVTSAYPGATRDFASLYVTPGLRFKFLPATQFSPWLSVGGGWALYEQSLRTIGGNANPAPRLTHRGALQFGAGFDIRGWRFIGFRAEVRDFYSGSPVFNTSTPGGQRSVVASGGIVLRFGE